MLTMINSHTQTSRRCSARVAVARALAAGALLTAPLGVAVYTAGSAVADHGDGGYLDSGSYDEATNVVDDDATQTEFDDDGYQAASSGAAGACYVPFSKC
jgi:hypothetical protein